MGIAKGALKLLIQEAKKRSFKGKSILQLGRQHTFLTVTQAYAIAKQMGFQTEEIQKIQLSLSKDPKLQGCIDDITLFTLLGFTTVHSLDASSYEHSTIVHDLNTPVPSHLHHSYDVIFDGGTLEHVFHLPQVLKNIHALLKKDGRIIHCSPSHNHVDHGFYMFSPTFFYDYYSANHYPILTSYIFEYAAADNSDWKHFAYHPGSLDALSFGGFGKKLVGIWFIAQKTANSTDNQIPQQGAYVKTWKAPIQEPKKQNALRAWLKSFPLLHTAVTFIKRKTALFIQKKKLKKITVG